MSGRRITWDAERNSTSDRELGSGTVGQISFRRLVILLTETGEIKANERVTHIEVSPTGLRYRVELG